MKILLLAAMDKEINLLLNLLENIEEAAINNLKIWSGKIGSHEVSVSKCGIGKVNSVINTQILLQSLKPELVINSGVAGGAGLPIASVLIADNVAYHDVWCGPGTEYGQADGMPLFMKPSNRITSLIHGSSLEGEVRKGLICSGDKFISTANEIQFIREKFPDVKAVDMESASIAQTCIINGTEFAIIRVISDTPGEGENISQYKDFWVKAPEKTFNVVSKILKLL